MKIVVIGGTGLIGAKTADLLQRSGQDVVVASPTVGVNTVTGEGLTGALAGAQVVIDLSNAPSRDARAALDFFETSGRNLLAAIQPMLLIGPCISGSRRQHRGEISRPRRATAQSDRGNSQQ